MGINESCEGRKYDFANKDLFCPWSVIQFDEMFVNLGICQIEKMMYLPQYKIRTWEGKILEEISTYY